MLNSYGKLRGEAPPKRVWIVWTAGWVEPDDKWMMVTIFVMALRQSPKVGHYHPLISSS